VVGGRRVERQTSTPRLLSVLVLNRGGRFNRADFFDSLQQLRPAEVISIEPTGTPYDVESLSNRYTNLRFLLLHEDANRGQQVNLGIQEAHGRFVLVLWNDMQGISMPMRVLERMRDQGTLCSLPVLKNDKGEIVPSIQAPAFYRKLLKVVAIVPTKDGMPGLFPYDYVGVYDRERFSLTGGFDGNLANSYWQKMDFGFRVHMWGESINSNLGFRMAYMSKVPSEDITPDDDYRTFYLKNLSVRFTADHGQLPFSRFIPFHTRAGTGLISSYRLFRDIQRWVYTNRYRFQQDARSITDLWEVRES
jgi:hypothetical protein